MCVRVYVSDSINENRKLKTMLRCNTRLPWLIEGKHSYLLYRREEENLNIPVHKCIFPHIRTHTYKHVHTHVGFPCAWLHVCMRTYARMYACLCLCLCLRLCLRLCLHVYVHARVHVRVRVCAHGKRAQDTAKIWLTRHMYEWIMSHTHSYVWRS